TSMRGGIAHAQLVASEQRYRNRGLFPGPAVQVLYMEPGLCCHQYCLVSGLGLDTLSTRTASSAGGTPRRALAATYSVLLCPRLVGGGLRRRSRCHDTGFLDFWRLVSALACTELAAAGMDTTAALGC